MPELPEVETTLRGLSPHLVGQRIHGVILRRPDLRWPIPEQIERLLPGATITNVRRRAKYLLIDTDAGGSALLHLGMSGSLRVLPGDTLPRAHDHVDISLQNGRVLRFNDPRRFGCLLWQSDIQAHELLAALGPEPLSEAFTGDYLHALAYGRRAPVKTFLMDQAVVVGVGNIYAAESCIALESALCARLERYHWIVIGGWLQRSRTSCRTPSDAAVLPCVISLARTVRPVISNRSLPSTAAKASPANNVDEC